MAVPIALLASLAQTGYQMYKGQEQKKAADRIKVGKRGLSEYTRKADRARELAAGTTGYAGQDQARQQQEANVSNLLELSKTDPRAYNTAIANAMGTMSSYNLQDASKEAAFKQKLQAASIASKERLGKTMEGMQDKDIKAAAAQKTALGTTGEKNVFSGVTGALGAVAKTSQLGELNEKTTTDTTVTDPATDAGPTETAAVTPTGTYSEAPLGMPPEEWARMNDAQKKEYLANQA